MKFNVLLRNRKLSLTSEVRLWPQFPQCSTTPLPKLTLGPSHNQSIDLEMLKCVQKIAVTWYCRLLASLTWQKNICAHCKIILWVPKSWISCAYGSVLSFKILCLLYILAQAAKDDYGKWPSYQLQTICNIDFTQYIRCCLYAWKSFNNNQRWSWFFATLVALHFTPVSKSVAD